MFKKSIPNLLTFLNLSLGIFSILESFNRKFILAAIFIISAALIDRYDGRIARFFNVSSEIGKELDSLSDLISFGVAPALLIIVKYNLDHFPHINALTTCFVLIYVLCGAYRLARYNTSSFNGIFTGVPITVAGSMLALFSLVAPISSNSLFSIVLLVILSYFMISKYEFKKI